MGAEFEDGYAVTVAMRGGEWVVAGFDDDFEHLSTAVKAVRNLRSEGAAFALLNVEEEYLVIVRPGPSDVRVLISDATMGVDDDFAAEILDQAGIDIPDIIRMSWTMSTGGRTATSPFWKTLVSPSRCSQCLSTTPPPTPPPSSTPLRTNSALPTNWTA